jgi:hypothetical protein
MTIIPGYPFALVSNNLVTDVIYMQTDDQSTIDETLSKFSYDEYVKYGEHLSIGQEKYNGFFRYPSPYESWIWDDELKIWKAPVEPPLDGNAYLWNEDSLSWGVCTNCG